MSVAVAADNLAAVEVPARGRPMFFRPMTAKTISTPTDQRTVRHCVSGLAAPCPLRSEITGPTGTQTRSNVTNPAGRLSHNPVKSGTGTTQLFDI
jgi:hypothetical protein